MAKRPTIAVTKKDIMEGITSNSCCPIALAIRRRFNIENANEVNVDQWRIRIRDCEYDPPAKASDFIREFDRHNSQSVGRRRTQYGWAADKQWVEPFRFKLPAANKKTKKSS